MKAIILLMFITSIYAKKFTIYNGCVNSMKIGQMTLDTYLNCNRPIVKLLPKRSLIVDTDEYSEVYFFANGQNKALNLKTKKCENINKWTVTSLVKDHAGFADEMCYTSTFNNHRYHKISADMKLCGC